MPWSRVHVGVGVALSLAVRGCACVPVHAHTHVQARTTKSWGIMGVGIMGVRMKKREGRGAGPGVARPWGIMGVRMKRREGRERGRPGRGQQGAVVDRLGGGRTFGRTASPRRSA
jgi:hypothetical protein